MLAGKLTNFDHDKFYGFTQPDDGSKEVFVHGSALRRSGINDPRIGDRLAFAIEQFNGRDCAGALYRLSCGTRDA